MTGLRLYKKEKLCGTASIDRLFLPGAADVHNAMAYPLRGVWRVNSHRRSKAQCPRVAIVVPKKRLRHAVDRVLMRRRIREAYRLNRLDSLPYDTPVDLCLVYVADDIVRYHKVEKSVKRIFASIQKTLASHDDT